MSVELILNLKKACIFLTCLQLKKKISPKTFGLHCVRTVRSPELCFPLTFYIQNYAWIFPCASSHFILLIYHTNKTGSKYIYWSSSSCHFFLKAGKILSTHEGRRKRQAARTRHYMLYLRYTSCTRSCTYFYTDITSHTDMAHLFIWIFPAILGQ